MTYQLSIIILLSATLLSSIFTIISLSKTRKKVSEETLAVLADVCRDFYHMREVLNKYYSADYAKTKLTAALRSSGFIVEHRYYPDSLTLRTIVHTRAKLLEQRVKIGRQLQELDDTVRAEKKANSEKLSASLAKTKNDPKKKNSNS